MHARDGGDIARRTHPFPRFHENPFAVTDARDATFAGVHRHRHHRPPPPAPPPPSAADAAAAAAAPRTNFRCQRRRGYTSNAN